MGPIPVWLRSLYEEEIWTQMCTEGSDVKTQEEDGRLQAEEGGLEHIFPQSLRRFQTFQRLHLIYLASRTVGK